MRYGNPWIFEQAQALGHGRVVRPVADQERGRFLLAYVDLLLSERTGETDGFRHTATAGPKRRSARSRERWVINKLRALGSWYTKGLDNGSTAARGDQPRRVARRASRNHPRILLGDG